MVFMDIACLVFFYHDFKLLTTSVSLGLRRYCVSTYVISFFTCACRSTVNNCMVESPNLKRMCASTAGDFFNQFNHDDYPFTQRIRSLGESKPLFRTKLSTFRLAFLLPSNCLFNALFLLMNLLRICNSARIYVTIAGISTSA